MLSDPHLPSWPGADDRIVVEEMLRDNLSEHWYDCREFVRKQVHKKAGSNAQQDRDDIVQDVMGHVYRSLATFRFRCRFTTWLITIINHCIIDGYRKAQRSEQTPISSIFAGDPYETSEQEAEMHHASVIEVEEHCILRDQLEVGMKALREYAETHAHVERNTIILSMVILEGRSIEDAAKAARCSPAVAGYVVRQAQWYARRKRDQNR